MILVTTNGYQDRSNNMKEFTLIRTYLPDNSKTIGRLIYRQKPLDAPFELKTLELPWRDNKTNVSCIPEGMYKVNRDKYGNHQFYAIEGVVARSAIEIHIGNTVADLLGCIALGEEFTPDYNLANSRKALLSLLDFVGDEIFILHIRQYNPLTDYCL